MNGPALALGVRIVRIVSLPLRALIARSLTLPALIIDLMYGTRSAWRNGDAWNCCRMTLGAFGETWTGDVSQSGGKEL